MRAAAILGLGCSQKDLKPFQPDKTQGANSIEWRMGMPASHDQADVIVVFGGDGTIHRHLGQLVRIGLPVLVVPAGSGNDFARALGLRRVRDALGAWQKFCGDTGNVRTIDLGVISGVENAGGAPAPHKRYFCCVAGVGLDGEVARRANRLPRWLRGHGGYVLSLAPTIFSFRPVPMKIFTSREAVTRPESAAELRSAGQPAAPPPQHTETGRAGDPGAVPTDVSWISRSDQPTLLAAFANAPVYGGGMKIAPQAKMDDGLLDVCIVGGVYPFKLCCMFPTVYAGRHLTIKEVEYFHTGRVRVETVRPLDVNADGEYVCQTPVEIAVQGSALKVVTP
ncbi:MAG: diacylglycerol kinase family protein [Candidatus Sulfotelmatobacter sp.]|jgi:diacylglycerol kinase (ATP)